MPNHCLHVMTVSPSDGPGFQDALAAIASGDRLLFAQNGVYALLPAHRHYLQTLASKQVDCYALEEDCLARGLRVTDTEVSGVSYNGFVELVTTTDKTCTWL